MSLRKPIDDYCKECIYDPATEGTWRQQVSLCSVNSCPLWSVRPRPIQCTSNSKLSENCTHLAQSEALEGQSDAGES